MLQSCLAIVFWVFRQRSEMLNIRHIVLRIAQHPGLNNDTPRSVWMPLKMSKSCIAGSKIHPIRKSLYEASAMCHRLIQLSPRIDACNVTTSSFRWYPFIAYASKMPWFSKPLRATRSGGSFGTAAATDDGAVADNRMKTRGCDDDVRSVLVTKQFMNAGVHANRVFYAGSSRARVDTAFSRVSDQMSANVHCFCLSLVHAALANKHTRRILESA